MGGLEWSTAISACEALSYAGYDDWYLPNKDELNAMYINKAEIGGFNDKNFSFYWSSIVRPVHASNDYAWCQDFYDGEQAYSVKKNNHRVRCVRRD